MCLSNHTLSALFISLRLGGGVLSVMRGKRLNVDWKSVDGAAVRKRILKLKSDDEGYYLCPVETCLHTGFKSDRGLRKHVNTMHPWYFYFDEQPLINRNEVALNENVRRKSSTHNAPAFSLIDGLGKEFLDWLKTPCGGGKSKKQAVQIGRRAMKFLMASLGDTEVDKTISDEFMDCCLGSPSIVINFFKIITTEWKLSSSAAFNYMKAINDLMDFRKANGVGDDVLRSFTVSEVYLRRGKENLSKQKKIEYSRNLDLEQLICRESWATVEEMEKVIPYHTPKYKYVLDLCRREGGCPTISQLAFTTRFIATFLFLRVKCTRPMTYQYLTLQMLKDAKDNGGFIDQTAFKTEQQYAFDTIIITADVFQVINSYVDVIRPRLNPTCEYLLLTTNGKQYTALGSAMSILVHQAIEKYVNPTRYRQIIESESAERLTPEEMAVVSKDQKHSSYVAKRIYQKKLSRDVATQGRSCMQKIVGEDRDTHTKEIAGIVSDEPSTSSTNVLIEDELSTSGSNAAVDVEEIMSIINAATQHPKDEEEASDGEEEDQIESLILDSSSTNATTQEASMTTETRTVSSSSNIGLKSSPIVTVSRSTRATTQIKPTTTDEMELDVKEELVEAVVSTPLCQKRFSLEEDSILKEGIKKHGLGKWSLMLKDPSLQFPASRTRDALRMRADTLGLTKNKRNNRRKKTKNNPGIVN